MTTVQEDTQPLTCIVQALQTAVQRLEGYVKGLEQEVKTRK
jgi:hypothetical protein